MCHCEGRAHAGRGVKVMNSVSFVMICAAIIGFSMALHSAFHPFEWPWPKRVKPSKNDWIYRFAQTPAGKAYVERLRALADAMGGYMIIERAETHPTFLDTLNSMAILSASK